MPNPSHNHLARRERQIMEIVYRLGRATAAEVQAAMSDPPSYSAVRAHLRILEDRLAWPAARDTSGTTGRARATSSTPRWRVTVPDDRR